MYEGNAALLLLNLWAKSDGVTIQLKPLRQNFYMVLFISQDYKEEFKILYFFFSVTNQPPFPVAAYQFCLYCAPC